MRVEIEHRPVAEVLRRAGATVFERGWLSSNNILLKGDGQTALIDSGYCTHAEQTLSLVAHALENAPLDLLVNTHLHSDHCGGNAALQTRYPALRTLIPPGEAPSVAAWDIEALTYRATGQQCPRFHFDGVLMPGSTQSLGGRDWEVHAAKGHDPHSVILYLPSERLLVSADALWQNGFGVVFPELEGESAFDEVAETIDLIERLAPQTVIPGHGPVFQNIGQSITRARSRLQQFAHAPQRHQRHAMKVLVKFKLLEQQRMEQSELFNWAQSTPYLRRQMPNDPEGASAWLTDLIGELVRSEALLRSGSAILNC